jgi:predicted RND superfamily exporter protein
MATSILFVWIVLLLLTRNYWVSFFATLSIMVVVGTIMSSIYLQGWSLGMAESLGLIVFVGTSVDYIVHMCHQYIQSIHDKRKKKVDICF